MTTVLFTLQDGTPAGTERRVVQVARRLMERGHKAIVAIPLNGLIGAHLRAAGVPTHEVPFLRLRKTPNPLYQLAWLLSVPVTAAWLAWVIRRDDVDVVYNNQVTQIQSAIAAKVARRPLIWHLINPLPTPVERAFGLFVRLLADRVVVSSAARGELARSLNGYRGPYAVIHAPVDIERFRPGTARERKTARAELGVADSQFLVGTVCHFTPEKGIESLLEVARRIAPVAPQVVFCVIGPIVATQRKYFEDLLDLRARLGVSARVLFPGPRENVDLLMRGMDAFVLPSWIESSPLAVLEAMATQLPVIASDVGGLREIIADGESGLLCPAGDIDCFADAVSRVVRDESLRLSLGTAARKRVESSFTLDHAAGRVERIVEEALTGGMDSAAR